MAYKYNFFLQYSLYIKKKVVHLQSHSGQIEIWCNGSTTDSGSVSEGSSPSISTFFVPSTVRRGSSAG